MGVDSLISSFGQTAIYLFPLAFAISAKRKQEKKKKKYSVLFVVYRASSAIPQMKGDLAFLPHLAVTTPTYTDYTDLHALEVAMRGNRSEWEEYRKEEEAQPCDLNNIGSHAPRWMIYGHANRFRFHRTRQSDHLLHIHNGYGIDDRFDKKRTKSEHGSMRRWSSLRPFRPSSSLHARAREIVPNEPRAV